MMKNIMNDIVNNKSHNLDKEKHYEWHCEQQRLQFSIKNNIMNDINDTMKGKRPFPLHGFAKKVSQISQKCLKWSFITVKSFYKIL